MNSTFFNRRKLMTSLAAVVSAVSAGTLMTTSAQAKARDAGVRKLGRDGKPADGKQMITALITQTLVGGGQKLFMPMYIYQQASTLSNWPFAAAISIIFLIAVFAVVAVFTVLGRLSRGYVQA